MTPEEMPKPLPDDAAKSLHEFRTQRLRADVELGRLDTAAHRAAVALLQAGLTWREAAELMSRPGEVLSHPQLGHIAAGAIKTRLPYSSKPKGVGGSPDAAATKTAKKAKRSKRAAS